MIYFLIMDLFLNYGFISHLFVGELHVVFAFEDELQVQQAHPAFSELSQLDHAHGDIIGK